MDNKLPKKDPQASKPKSRFRGGSPRPPQFTAGGICSYCGQIVGPNPELQRQHEEEKGCYTNFLQPDADYMGPWK